MKKRLLTVLLILTMAAGLCVTAGAYDYMNPPSPGAADGFVVSRSIWDSTLMLPGHNATEYEYDFDNMGRVVRRTEIYQDAEMPELNSTSTYLYDYDAEGRLARTVRDDGNHEMVYYYNADGSHQQIYTWYDSDNNKRVRVMTYDPCADWYWYGEWTFQFDNKGNITSRKNTDSGEEIVYANTYDAKGRLSEVVMTSKLDGTQQTQTFTYSADGGYVLSWASRTGAEIFTYNAKHQLVQYANTYDGEGRDPIKYYYDSDGNCIQIYYSETTHRNMGYYPKPEAKSGWAWEDGSWFYYESGVPATGWRQINKVWYYFDQNGVMQTDWQKINGVWYFFESSGAMHTGWLEIFGDWYYLQASGAMVTGWQKVGNVWYYFAPNGVMQTGWQKINGKTYFFKSSGAMAASEYINGWWLNADGSWTYEYRADWHKNARGWWFGDASGWYARNTTLKIDGTLYTFDSAGYLK